MVRFHPAVEIAINRNGSRDPNDWSYMDITRYVHDPTGISITRGRGDRTSEATPASCSLTLLNPAGIWVPDNPVGAFYGLFDINTPLRVSMRANTNSAADAFGRTASSSWGSADIGGAWTTVGTASDYSVSPGAGRHTHSSAAVSHFSTLAFSLARVDVRVRVRVNALSTGASQVAGVTVRYVDSSNQQRAELSFTTSAGITARLVSRASGSDTVTSSAATGLTHSATTWYWIRLQTGNTVARVKAWQDGTDEPATWLIDGTNGVMADTTAGPVGVYSRRETGNTNASATFDFTDFAMVDGPIARFTGPVDTWPTTWTDASERQSLAPINAVGWLQLAADAKAFRSPLYRVLATDPALVAYWPMEDGSGSTAFASAGGGKPAPFIDAQPGSDSAVLGSDPLPVFGGNSHVSLNVPTYPATSTWSLRFVCRVPATPSAGAQLISWITPTGNPIVRWQFTINPGSPDTISLSGWGANGSVVFAGTVLGFVDFDGNEVTDGRQLYFSVDGTQSGADIRIDWSYTFLDAGDPVPLTVAAWTDTATSSQIGNISAVYFDGANGFPSGNVTLGHIAVGTDPLSPVYGLYASIGYYGLAPWQHLDLLASDLGASSIFGELLGETSGPTAQKMGTQRSGDPLTLLREVEASEQGVLFDGTEGQLAILPRSLRYNHAVNLALDHDAGHIKEGFRVERDTQLVRNVIDVTNATGFRATASDPVSIARYGSRPQSVNVNTVGDLDAAQHANWLLSAGRTLDRRYPSVTIELHRSSDLVSPWLLCDIGSKVTIANLAVTADTAEQVIDGYTETFNSSFWTVGLNLSSSRPWDAYAVESANGNLGRADTSGSTLLAGVTSSATTLQVASLPGKRRWSTTATPYDVGIAGERLTATAVGPWVSDVFGRSTSNGWGSEPTSGTAYATSGGSASDYATGAGVGTLSLGSVNTLRQVFLDVGGADQTVRVDISLPVTSAAGAAITQWVCVRVVDASNMLIARLNLTTAGAVTLELAKRISGSVSTIVGATTLSTAHVSGAWWTVAVDVSGDTIQAKAWTGGSEPPAYQISGPTDSAVDAGTQIAVLGRLESGNTNTTPVVMSVDNIVVSHPQRMTVTRSVNGVTKAQSAGASVSLWRPGRVAL